MSWNMSALPTTHLVTHNVKKTSRESCCGCMHMQGQMMLGRALHLTLRLEMILDRSELFRELSCTVSKKCYYLPISPCPAQSNTTTNTTTISTGVLLGVEDGFRFEVPGV